MAILKVKSGKKKCLKKYYLKSEESPEEPMGTFLRAVTP